MQVSQRNEEALDKLAQGKMAQQNQYLDFIAQQLNLRPKEQSGNSVRIWRQKLDMASWLDQVSSD